MIDMRSIIKTIAKRVDTTMMERKKMRMKSSLMTTAI